MDWTDGQIRELRQALRLSQADLAAAVDVSVRAVQAWESGASKPQPSAQRALDRLNSQRDATAPRPPSPALEEATYAELLAEVGRRLAAAERVLDGQRFRFGGEPSNGSGTLSGGTDRQWEERQGPDAQEGTDRKA